ncbi:hypothetical protein E4K72_04710 [Oxalobacteraceae bacterium OM1]|nr:hypothetical protein E4K72_04710 [Oxalobacteraceae bacterium OM1]
MTTRTLNPSRDWAERTLSTGVKLSVEGLLTLRIGDSSSFMFTVPIQAVRQVTLVPRSNTALPWNVDIAYQGAHFSFVCAEGDLAAVRYIFAGIPLIDMAVRLRRTSNQ